MKNTSYMLKESIHSDEFFHRKNMSSSSLLATVNWSNSFQRVPPSGETVSRVVVEFLDVAITSIVFLKGFYSPGAFERRRYMNVVVHRARHPQLREYIHSSVTELLPFIQKGMIERVAIIFSNSENIPVERFVFKLSVNLSCGSEVEETDLESLRSILIKLPVSASVTKVLPPGGRWEIAAYFRSIPEASTNKSAELWVPTDTKQWFQPPLITPLKSISSVPMCFAALSGTP